MAQTEDLTAFLSEDDFAVSASIMGQPVVGIFDNGYAAALGGFAESARPTFKCLTTDIEPLVNQFSTMRRVTGLEHASLITIDSVEYAVTEIHPDGQGFTDVILEVAP